MVVRKKLTRTSGCVCVGFMSVYPVVDERGRVLTYACRDADGEFKVVVNRPVGPMCGAFDRETGTELRSVRVFSEDVEKKTLECLDALYYRTTEEKLLEITGGNKWIARRAVELYKLGCEVEGYRHLHGKLGVFEVDFIG